jgi:outer membrane protein assembly factor BamB
LLIGGVAGGVAVVGGVAGWALSARSAGGTPTVGSGSSVPAGSVAVPTSTSLQQYYGAGSRVAAAWRFRTGNAVDANPGAAGSLVYAGSTDNNVYALDIANGKQAWKYPAGAVYAAPQAVGDMVCLATTAGHFYALRAATGKPAWTLDTGSPAVYKRTWAADGAAVILSSDTGPLRSYHAATGAAGPSFATQEPYVQALTAAGGVLYALDGLGVLYAFKAATGDEIWHRQLLTQDDTAGTGLTVAGGTVYLGTVSGTLYAVSAASGKQQWTYHPGSGMESELAADDGLVYVKDNNGTLHAVAAASGKAAWARAGTATGLYGVAAAGGRVYYSTVLAVQALDAKAGTPVWAFNAPANGEFLSTPAVASGLVFIGCHDDSLYAVKA